MPQMYVSVKVNDIDYQDTDHTIRLMTGLPVRKIAL